MGALEKEKVHKLIGKIGSLVEAVDKYERDFVVRRAIDPYSLIQRAVEMTFLFEASQRMRVDQQRMKTHYAETYLLWRDGARWLNAYNREAAKQRGSSATVMPMNQRSGRMSR